MQLDRIPKDSLKAGDILLCNIPKLSFQKYMGSIVATLKHYLSTKEFRLDEATPLIHWIIGVFDEYHYCHASFWNGEEVVESRLNGLWANDISTYSEDAVDVYRYHRDGKWVGDSCLPVGPLLRKAQDLVDRHWTYGFDSAYMLAILCVTRWHRAEWVDRIRDLVIGHAPPSLTEPIQMLFREYRRQIDDLIEQLIVQALEVVRKYRKQEGYVCSQTVAVIYNEACDEEHRVGRYKIVKPTHLAATTPLELCAQLSLEVEGIAACEDMVQQLQVQLEQLRTASTPLVVAAAHTDYETVHTNYQTWQAGLRNDTFYMPRDLAKSENTELVGRLVL
jgi:hypothetical protein